MRALSGVDCWDCLWLKVPAEAGNVSLYLMKYMHDIMYTRSLYHYRTWYEVGMRKV
jgi:hypothetical protein